MEKDIGSEWLCHRGAGELQELRCIAVAKQSLAAHLATLLAEVSHLSSLSRL